MLTEQEIQDMMRVQGKGRSSIAVAYRPLTNRGPNVILCIENGCISEIGGYDAMKRLGGKCAVFSNGQITWGTTMG